MLENNNKFIFHNIPYKITGYSIITFSDNNADYLNRIDEIIENSKFYTPIYGRDFTNTFNMIVSIIQYADKLTLRRFPDFLFLKFPNSIGTYICKKHYE